MFSSTQAINVSKGCYNMPEYRRAVSRLAFVRRLHASWHRPLVGKRLRRISLHEQPPGARIDWGWQKKRRNRRYKRGSRWPWAVGPHCRRSTVNGCMVGVKGRCNKPVFKGWTFESDADTVHKALQGFSCSRDHEHAITRLSQRNRPTQGRAGREITYIKRLEKYPQALGALLACSCGQMRGRT